MSEARAQRRRDARIIGKAARHCTKHGCARCGGHGSTSIADVHHDGTVVCRACLTEADEGRIAISFAGVADASDAQLADRDWFAANPGKEWRVRPLFHMEREELIAGNQYHALALGGELPINFNIGVKEGTSVMVYQARPGKRLRMICTPPDEPCDLASWVERVALPEVRRRVAGAMPEVFTATPEHNFRATNALAIAQIPGCETIFAEALQQGQAMREARQRSRQ